jgi:hypothetical protein
MWQIGWQLCLGLEWLGKVNLYETGVVIFEDINGTLNTVLQPAVLLFNCQYNSVVLKDNKPFSCTLHPNNLDLSQIEHICVELNC